MRIDYFKLGSICYTDEINGLLSIYLSEKNYIKETIELHEEGFVGKFADYRISIEPYVDDLGENIVLKPKIDDDGEVVYDDDDNPVKEGTIIIKCNTDMNCKFILLFDNQEFVSSLIDNEQTIVVDLTTVSYLVDDLINNKFIIKCIYDLPYISPLAGIDNLIDTTTELKNKIQTSFDGEEILLTGKFNYETERYEIVHNLDEPIDIDKKIILNSEHDIYIIGDNSDCKVFVLDDGENMEADLTLNNLHFMNISSSTNGGCIENITGELNVNNCSFNNCTSDSYGGAIYSSGNLNINETKFVDCEASNGGAVFTWKDGEL